MNDTLDYIKLKAGFLLELGIFVCEVKWGTMSGA